MLNFGLIYEFKNELRCNNKNYSDNTLYLNNCVIIVKKYIDRYDMINTNNIIQFINMNSDVCNDVIIKYLSIHIKIPISDILKPIPELVFSFSFRKMCRHHTNEDIRKFIIAMIKSPHYIYQIAVSNRKHSFEYIMEQCIFYDLYVFDIILSKCRSYGWHVLCDIVHVIDTLQKYKDIYLYNRSLRSAWILSIIEY